MKATFIGAIAALSFGAAAITATPALADPGHGHRHGHYKHGNKHWKHGGPPRHAPAYGYRDGYREGYRDSYRSARANWRYYDYNRYDPVYRGYYADRYYVGSGYRPIRVDRSTRFYRGYDGRYYCRRSDGTTGLIVGAAIGGLLGNSIDRGHSSVAGTIIGASAGALLGREIDRGSVSCR